MAKIKTPKLKVEIRIEKGDKTASIPFHIVDIALDDTFQEASKVEIKAIITDRKEWENWGKGLSLLPFGN